MNIMNQIGISYEANYLVQGNQIDRCKISTKLKVKNIELQIRSDGKDFNISTIKKNFKDNIIFHMPTLNVKLKNLKELEEQVKELVKNNIKMVTINASNLNKEVFDFCTVEEQKEYFSNIVTAIATLAQHKIVVAVENMPSNNEFFGSTLEEVSDIIIYSKKMLIKKFKFNEDDANKYIGLCLNTKNILKSGTINDVINWLKVFDNNIKCIKVNNNKDIINTVINLAAQKEYEFPIIFTTKKELEEVDKEYKKITNIIKEILKIDNVDIKEEKQPKQLDENGFSNIIVLSIVLMTIVIAILMVLVKFKA